MRRERGLARSQNRDVQIKKCLGPIFASTEDDILLNDLLEIVDKIIFSRFVFLIIGFLYLL